MLFGATKSTARAVSLSVITVFVFTLGVVHSAFAQVTFQEKAKIAGAGGNTIAVGDINKDGKTDALSWDGANSLSTLTGNGDGTFVTGKVPGYQRVSSVALADVVSAGTSAGVPDAIVTSVAAALANNGAATVLSGDGSGQLAYFDGQTTGAQPLAGELADFDGNGRLDLFVSNSFSSNASVFSGGNGTSGNVFSSPSLINGFPARSMPYAVALGDLNGDQRVDALVYDDYLSGYYKGLFPLLNDGAGGFTIQSRIDIPFVRGSAAQSSSLLQLGDMNNDGKLDVMVARGSSSEQGGVLLFLGNGNGTFSSPSYVKTTTANDVVYSIAMSDFNGDGKLDAAVSDSSGADILVGHGDGTFDPVSVPMAGSTRSNGSIVAGDFNGDSKPDLLVGLRNGMQDISPLLNTTSFAVPQQPGAATDTVTTTATQPPSTTGAVKEPDLKKCTIPNLARLSRKQAKTKLVAARCKLGKVQRKKRSRAAVRAFKRKKYRLVVVKQSLPVNRVVASGSSVNIVLDWRKVKRQKKK